MHSVWITTNSFLFATKDCSKQQLWGGKEDLYSTPQRLSEGPDQIFETWFVAARLCYDCKLRFFQTGDIEFKSWSSIVMSPVCWKDNRMHGVVFTAPILQVTMTKCIDIDCVRSKGELLWLDSMVSGDQIHPSTDSNISCFIHANAPWNNISSISHHTMQLQYGWIAIQINMMIYCI